MMILYLLWFKRMVIILQESMDGRNEEEDITIIESMHVYKVDRYEVQYQGHRYNPIYRISSHANIGV